MNLTNKYEQIHTICSTSIISCHTIFAVIQVNVAINNDAEEKLDNQVTEIKNRIERRIQAYEQVLSGGKGLFASSQEVTREEWKTFVEIQSIGERFPGIQGVGFSKLIGDKNNLETHIDQMRKEGFSDYTVRPEGDREEYHSVIYLEPFNERNKRVFGYDMYSEQTRQYAMDLSRDTGLPTISGKVRLVQETEIDVQAGFKMYNPIYAKEKPTQTIEQRRAAFEGFVYAPFRMNDFTTQVLSITNPGITIRIYDMNSEPQNILYDHTKVKNTNEDEINYSLSKSITIDINQRQWILEGTALKSINSEIEKLVPFAILMIGLVLSSMLFFIFRAYSKIITMTRQSLQKEKMASMGELAARLVHDIRSPLSSIISWTEIIQLHLKEAPNEKIASYAKSILKSTDSIKFQLNTVIDFVRARPTQISKNSIMLVIFDAIKITPIPDTVKINIPENDLDIECDKSQMIVVFSNLITNSIQAMNEKGNITINVETRQNNAIIDFIDSGPGISKENLSKIFEPLFTTKSMGTGLGLVSCKNIIEYHHGKISVKNNPTTFTIEIPIKQ
ncbi:MAG: CHASE domain-containing protein [Nitrosarchaeum sp.]|nr:CHASE domain-containing protein [Nitrosarchaeum sp.]